jgi:glutaredoxin
MRDAAIVPVLIAATLALLACGSRDEDAEIAPEQEPAEEALDLTGEVVTPPFAVRGEADELLLVWFDGEGPHTATKRSDIPEAARARVRVDSLRIAPDARLDPGSVYVADLRAAGTDGRYPVRRITREAFEVLVDRAAPRVEAPAAVAAGTGTAPPPGTAGGTDPNADVIIYGASWCGACRATAQFFRSRGVAFAEKDIERDPAALAEMQQKAARAGLRPSGIPVIDFRGTILPGFDQARLEQLIAARPL